ncbi:MAG: hypothetical protein H5T69_06800 [Chloroflexi bacterium]|nr:hypothetical protein [Chloroflexota bacterium]
MGNGKGRRDSSTNNEAIQTLLIKTEQAFGLLLAVLVAIIIGVTVWAFDGISRHLYLLARFSAYR